MKDLYNNSFKVLKKTSGDGKVFCAQGSVGSNYKNSHPTKDNLYKISTQLFIEFGKTIFNFT